MGLFDRMKEPVFLKEGSDAEKHLKKLRGLKPLLTEDGKLIIERNIQKLEAGITSEKSISDELMKSHMPMYILHDIHLVHGKVNAQIDYLVFTKKICFVIESKDLFGDIEITSAGDFIRTTFFGGRKKREDILSPIKKGEGHLKLMKEIKMDSSKGKLSQLMVGNFFGLIHKSFGLLGTPKSDLDLKRANKEIKNKVIRVNQLVKYLKSNYAKSEEPQQSDFQLKEWAKSYLLLHKQIEMDSTTKYKKYLRTTA